MEKLTNIPIPCYPISKFGTEIPYSPTGIVMSIANALDLKINHDKDENGKVIGISVFAGDCLRLSDHCTDIQKLVDEGILKTHYLYNIVICDNPSEQQSITNVQNESDYSISEFIYSTQGMTTKKMRIIANDIKHVIDGGEYENNFIMK